MTNQGLDLCPGRGQDTGYFLPPSAASGSPLGKHGGKEALQPSQMWNHFNGVDGVPPLLPHLGSLVWICASQRGLRSACPPQEQLCPHPPPEPGASGQGRSSHVQLTAVVAPGLRRPPPGFSFSYSGPLLGWLLLPATRAANGQWGPQRRGGEGWGRVDSTCFLSALLPVTFTSKSQEVLPFLCGPLQTWDSVFPPGNSRFSVCDGWDLSKELGKASWCLLSTCQVPDAHHSRRWAGHRLAGLVPSLMQIVQHQQPLAKTSTSIPPLPQDPSPGQRLFTNLQRKVLPALVVTLQ